MFIDQSHKSHNAPVPYPTMDHSEQKYWLHQIIGSLHPPQGRILTTYSISVLRDGEICFQVSRSGCCPLLYGRVLIVWLSSPAWHVNLKRQGKSEEFDNCERPSVLTKNWIQIVNFSACVTLKLDGWPRKMIGHIFYTASSFVHRFKAIGDFKLELQSGNAQFGSKSAIFCPVWPWNLTDDLEK